MAPARYQYSMCPETPFLVFRCAVNVCYVPQRNVVIHLFFVAVKTIKLTNIDQANTSFHGISVLAEYVEEICI